MKFQVLALPEVRSYFTELMQILYNEGYFSFEENAIEYVTDLFADIEQNLPVPSVPLSQGWYTWDSGTVRILRYF